MVVKKVNNIITEDKLDKYFEVTGKAIKKAESAKDESDETRLKQANDCLDMITRYYADAKFFREKGDYINSFAALNYAHGWLDAAARLRLFKVNDSALFTVDEEQEDMNINN